jgi:hypothetical protein
MNAGHANREAEMEMHTALEPPEVSPFPDTDDELDVVPKVRTFSMCSDVVVLVPVVPIVDPRMMQSMQSMQNMPTPLEEDELPDTDDELESPLKVRRCLDVTALVPFDVTPLAETQSTQQMLSGFTEKLSSEEPGSDCGMGWTDFEVVDNAEERDEKENHCGVIREAEVQPPTSCEREPSQGSLTTEQICQVSEPKCEGTPLESMTLPPPPTTSPRAKHIPGPPQTEPKVTVSGVGSSDGDQTCTGNSGQRPSPAFGKLSAGELVGWLNEHAPEQFIKDRLLQICEMAKDMQPGEGTDAGSASLAETEKKMYPWSRD